MDFTGGTVAIKAFCERISFSAFLESVFCKYIGRWCRTIRNPSPSLNRHCSRNTERLSFYSFPPGEKRSLPQCSRCREVIYYFAEQGANRGSRAIKVVTKASPR